MQASSLLFPRLDRSFKKQFPFRLSVPSYIYPAGYADNVQLLGSYVDEIELLLFESRSEALPSSSEIGRLVSLSREFELSYNIHLPLDLDLGATDAGRQMLCARRLIEIIDHIKPLSPSTYTLHLNCAEENRDLQGISEWQERIVQCIGHILPQSGLASRQMAVENLNYPPQWLAEIVDRLDLSVCLDVGHALRYGSTLQAACSLFGERIEMIHLHGAAAGADHLSLEHLPLQARGCLRSYLKGFRHAVSVEVFSFERLQVSLEVLHRMMNASGLPEEDKEISKPLAYEPRCDGCAMRAGCERHRGRPLETGAKN